MRHKTLLAKAVRMGTMIARGWIDTHEVRRALFAAAEANGQIKEYGRGHFNDTVKDGIAHGIKTPHPDLPDNEPPPDAATPPPGDKPREQATVEAVFDPWQSYIVPDFPIDVLPPMARDFACAQSEVIGCDVAGLAMSVLVAFSGALHHAHALRMLRNGSWWASPRLWVLLVGPPSSKKTPIFNAATDPLQKYECRLREKYEQELGLFDKTQEAGDKSVPEPEKPPRYVVWDTTVEKLGEILRTQR